MDGCLKKDNQKTSITFWWIIIEVNTTFEMFIFVDGHLSNNEQLSKVMEYVVKISLKFFDKIS
jgi:hypothetical protein